MIQERPKPTLICPACGKPMRFVRSIPGIGALPELWTFQCEACGVSLTEEKAALSGAGMSVSLVEPPTGAG